MLKDKKCACAYLKNLKTSPVKLNKVTRFISNMSVQEAMRQLSFCNLKIAPALKDLLKSAMCNAENNHGMDIDNLIVYRVETGKSFVMKRSMARAKGRGARILKPFCHVKIILTEVEK